MMPKNLPQNGHDFVEHLANFEPPPESIWLIGSRANGRANSSSDTDLLVFGSPELLQALSDAQLVPTDIDCLIVFDRNNYTDPFRIKSGSLSNLKWKSINLNLGHYVGIKWRPDEESDDDDMGHMDHLLERGIRIWPVCT